METVQTDRFSRSAHRSDPEHATEFGTPARRKPRRRPRLKIAVAAGVVVGIVLAAWLTRQAWLPLVRQTTAAVHEKAGSEAADSDHDHDQDHDHAGHGSEGTVPAGEIGSLELSPQGRKNIGLTLETVALRDFERTAPIPAVLVDRPGRTRLAVSAPMTGIVRRVYPLRGEAVSPGAPLFDLRLTHEDLVEKQSALLRLVEELDVVKQEVARLEEVTASGAVAGKRLLERRYEQQKLEGALRAGRQALALHGLTESQIEQIVRRRRLISSVTIKAPEPPDCEGGDGHEALLQVEELDVTSGEHVTTGTRLCTLADYCQVYVEGKAFAHDAEVLNEAARRAVPVTAVVEGDGSGRQEVPDLRILYVENEIDRDSRALRFYLQLPNQLIRNEQSSAGRRFIEWRYKSGQRAEALLPVKQWKDRIVLPVEAVVQDGTERFVYRQVGDRFERKAVHVEHRDPRWAVIENDGVLSPGDVVAGQGAFQIHQALKNQTRGGADPHAGHHH
ncbi:MAG: efflux RND transporter periplasmic adaptor subunit [Pirellulales bacterium]|nr:efflux RND transporter periplasmic adaptor subunit [Pirellulales bacterium]